MSQFINNAIILLESNPFETAAKPVTDLIEMALNPLLGLVFAIGAIYCVLLGGKLAKAEEPQDREKAKMALKNGLIGFVLIFCLLAALKVGGPAFKTWYQNVH